MPTIDFGICIQMEKTNINRLKSIILDSFKVISPDYIPYFISAYFYDTHTDKGVNIYSFDDSLQKVLDQSLYNKFVFTANHEQCCVYMGYLDESITIGINVDYDYIVQIAQQNSYKNVDSYLERNMYKLYGKTNYQFAFVDADSEFDYSYTELLEEVRGGNYPYTLLFIYENGALNKYQSRYDLLGICP